MSKENEKEKRLLDEEIFEIFHEAILLGSLEHRRNEGKHDLWLFKKV